MAKPVGWRNESRRHSLASKGIKTAVAGKPMLRAEQYKQGTILPLSEQRKNYEEYIVDAIYGEDEEGNEITFKTKKEALQDLRDTFRSEYGHEIPRKGERKAFGEWMLGLPSSFNVAYDEDEIITLAKRMGSLPKDATEKQEQKIVSNYENYMTNQTFRLFDKYEVK